MGTREDLDTGGARSVVIWSTGAVVGVKSLKALKAKECPVTGKPFDFDRDTVALAPNAEEFAKLKERLPAATKRKAETGTAAAAASGKPAAAEASSKEQGEVKKAKVATGKDELAGTHKTELYKKLFCKDREGMEGPRDPFGKPMYN